jgi:hypothetical protein
LPLLDDPYVVPTEYSDTITNPQYEGGNENDNYNNDGTINNDNSGYDYTEDDNVESNSTTIDSGNSGQKPPKDKPKKP